MKLTHLYYRPRVTAKELRQIRGLAEPPRITPQQLRLIRERAIRKRLGLLTPADIAELKLAEQEQEEDEEEEIELGDWQGPELISQKEFEESEAALAMERAARLTLQRLGNRRWWPSDAPEFPLESEDRRMQQLLDKFSFDLEWPARELVRGEWLRPRRTKPA